MDGMNYMFKKEKGKKEHPEVIRECFMEKVRIRLERWRGKLERHVRRNGTPGMQPSRRKDVRLKQVV